VALDLGKYMPSLASNEKTFSNTQRDRSFKYCFVKRELSTQSLPYFFNRCAIEWVKIKMNLNYWHKYLLSSSFAGKKSTTTLILGNLGFYLIKI